MTYCGVTKSLTLSNEPVEPQWSLGIFSLYRTLVRPILKSLEKLDLFHTKEVLFPEYFHTMESDKTMETGFSSLFTRSSRRRKPSLKMGSSPPLPPLGSTSSLDADWLARRQQSRSLFVGEEQITWRKWRRTTVGFSCLTWFFGLFAGTVISVTNAYAGCGRTLNFSERF